MIVKCFTFCKEMTHKQLQRPQPQQEFSYYDNDNTHGKLVGNAQRMAKGQRLQPAPGERCAQREWERETRTESESARRQRQQRRQLRCEWASKAEFKTWNSATKGGKTTARTNADEREIYIGQLPVLSQASTHMLIVLKRRENEMQRNEWATQNVRNKMETGTWK